MRTRLLRTFLFALPLLALAAAACAQEALKLVAGTPPEALKQCGDCHMIFPAQMLPQRSWRALMGMLDDHFGDIASVPDADAADILAYLTAHAADSPAATARERHFLGALAADAVPLRITRTPWWNQMHADFDFEGVRRTPVKTASNCLGCHPSGVK